MNMGKKIRVANDEMEAIKEDGSINEKFKTELIKRIKANITIYNRIMELVKKCKKYIYENYTIIRQLDTYKPEYFVGKPLLDTAKTQGMILPKDRKENIKTVKLFDNPDLNLVMQYFVLMQCGQMENMTMILVESKGDKLIPNWTLHKGHVRRRALGYNEQYKSTCKKWSERKKERTDKNVR